MSPQAATAMQPAKGPVPVKQSPRGDVLDQIQQTYDSIARRAFEIFSDMADGSATNWTIGSVLSPNCCTPYIWKLQRLMTT